MHIISKNVRIRVPESFDVGNDSVIDDWCYFSTRIRIGECCHIAPNCTIAGGREFLFSLGDLSGIAAGTRIYCSANDFSRDLIGLIPPEAGAGVIAGDVTLGCYTGVGANSVIMPDQDVPEGVAIGAQSFVPPAFRFEPWTVYWGAPIRPIGKRDRDRVLAQVDQIRNAREGQADQ